jgi:hypothetical protein
MPGDCNLIGNPNSLSSVRVNKPEVLSIGWFHLLDYIVTLATCIHANLYEPQAVAKLELERDRMIYYLSLGDQLEAKLVLCEVVFYAALAYHNSLLTYTEAIEKIAMSAYSVELSLLDAFQMAEIKYALRIQAGSLINLEAEREAIASYQE